MYVSLGEWQDCQTLYHRKNIQGISGLVQENNHGYARTAKEFREQLAGYLGGTFADVTTRQKGNTYYKDFTITEETKELYAKEYGYEETEFLAG